MRRRCHTRSVLLAVSLILLLVSCSPVSLLSRATRICPPASDIGGAEEEHREKAPAHVDQDGKEQGALIQQQQRKKVRAKE